MSQLRPGTTCAGCKPNGDKASVRLTQISKLLECASVAPTQGYQNLNLDLTTRVSSFIPFKRPSGP
jgi:hypothetical protein